MFRPKSISFAALFYIAINLGGCDKVSAPTNTPPPPSPRPTPVLNSITEACGELGNGAPSGALYVQPKSARLDIDKTAPKGAREELAQWLESHQQPLEQIEEFSKKGIEELPPDPPLEKYEKSPAWWIGHLGNILLIDAARQYEIGKPDIAAKRIATNLRLEIGLAKQSNRQHALGAGRMITLSCYRLDAIAKDGGFKTVSGAEIRTALSSLDPVDPIGILAEWESSARESVASYRQHYSGFGAGKKLAKQFEDFGIIAPDVATLPAAGQERILAIMPRKSAANRIKGMSAREVGRKFDEAEALISPIFIAISKHDGATLNSLGDQILQDDSQILRMIIGNGITLPDLNSLFTDAVKLGKAAAEQMAP